MSAESIIVRYDGAILTDHQMDVADLAPALLGMSDLCKLANKKFNGERAAIKVLIGADQEHQCFQFSLDIIQTLWQQASSLVGREEVKTAKDILEWLGLIGGPVLGLFGLMKFLSNKEIADTKFEVKDGKDIVQIAIKGDNTVIYAHRESYELLNEPTAVANAKKVIQPLTKPGYEEVEFESGSAVTEKITKSDAEAMVGHDSVFQPEVPAEAPQPVTAWIQVYAPVYDGSAPRWQFRYGEGHVQIDISETDIAKKAMHRGGALIDDTYKVILEILQTKVGNRFNLKYKIVKVLEFHPAQIRTQLDWIGDPEES